MLVICLTALLLFMSRNRPLFPAQTLIASLQTKYPQSKLLFKAQISYGFRSSFESFDHLFINEIPADESVVGYATTMGGAEPGLSLPLGRLKVERILPEDGPEQLQLIGIRYVVVDDSELVLGQETLEQWLARFHGHLVDQLQYAADPYSPPCHLYLVSLRGI